MGKMGVMAFVSPSFGIYVYCILCSDTQYRGVIYNWVNRHENGREGGRKENREGRRKDRWKTAP